MLFDLDAEDGHNLKLTIDVVIQHYAEAAIKNTEKNIKGSKARCIVMNPKTGEILAMAASGGFDPNDSREPEGKTAKAKFAKLSSKEKLKYLNNMPPRGIGRTTFNGSHPPMPLMILRSGSMKNHT